MRDTFIVGIIQAIFQLGALAFGLYILGNTLMALVLQGLGALIGLVFGLGLVICFHKRSNNLT